MEPGSLRLDAELRGQWRPGRLSLFHVNIIFEQFTYQLARCVKRRPGRKTHGCGGAGMPGGGRTFDAPRTRALIGDHAAAPLFPGEAVCCDDDGMPSFDRIRYRRHDASVFLYAFDLIELDGDDLRRETFETRKATLASLFKRAAPGLRLNEHIEADGPTVFAHACKMGLEGIVSKRKDSPYRSGRRPIGSRARTRLARL